ncbi:MAG: DUF4465 domain-containing protein [Bacteroidota bacterium]
MKQFFTLLFAFTFTFSMAQLTTANFENIQIELDSFNNGSDSSGGFSSGDIFLPNSFEISFGYESWTGWSISNTTDVTTPGFDNQYSSITGGGHNGSDNYALAYTAGGSVNLNLEGNAQGKPALGFWVTNGTYAYLSMLEGDQFAKKFGGITGDDPDFFLLTIKGFTGGALTLDSIDFYLADFRFTDNSQDYIVDEWTYIDLTSLGPVDSLTFSLSSTDVGTFGMNTPAYFFMDDFETGSALSVNRISEDSPFEIYPNPTTDFVLLDNPNAKITDIFVFDINGKLLLSDKTADVQHQIDLQKYPSGTYILKARVDNEIYSEMLIKQ